MEYNLVCDNSFAIALTRAEGRNLKEIDFKTVVRKTKAVKDGLKI